MAAKMLDEVLDKEKKAAQNEAEANVKADEIIVNAKAKAAEILEKAENDAERAEKSRIDKAVEGSEQALKNAVADAEKYAQMLEEKASSKFSEAVGIVRGIITQ